jgi:hypothetical protein
MAKAVLTSLFNGCMILSAIVAITIFVIMFVGTCESSGMQLRYISDHLASCQDKASYAALPWILAVLLGIQFYGLLLIFRDLHYYLGIDFGWKDASLHCFAFHAIFMLFSLVEFRNDRNNKGQCVILDSMAGIFDFVCDFFKSTDEGDLHIWAAVWCLLEFSILHALLAFKLYRKHVVKVCMFCTYVAVDTLYVVLVTMFVVFWLVQLTTAAQIFEWVLLIIAGFLQMIAIVNHASIQKLAKTQLKVENDAAVASEEERGLLPTQDTVHKPAEQKHIKRLWSLIILCVCLNIGSIMIIAPPSFVQSISAQLYTQTSVPFISITTGAACLIWFDWYLWTQSH